MYRFLLCLCVAVAAAEPIHYEQEYHYAPKYSYKYAVKDPHTHDMKSHEESRHGDEVQGSYRLVEPDGSLRIVNYIADGHSGFRAVVTNVKHHGEVSVRKEGHHTGLEHVAVSEVRNNLEGRRGEFGVEGRRGEFRGVEGRLRGELGAVSEVQVRRGPVAEVQTRLVGENRGQIAAGNFGGVNNGVNGGLQIETRQFYR